MVFSNFPCVSQFLSHFEKTLTKVRIVVRPTENARHACYRTPYTAARQWYSALPHTARSTQATVLPQEALGARHGNGASQRRRSTGGVRTLEPTCSRRRPSNSESAASRPAGGLQAAGQSAQAAGVKPPDRHTCRAVAGPRTRLDPKPLRGGRCRTLWPVAAALAGRRIEPNGLGSKACSEVGGRCLLAAVLSASAASCRAPCTRRLRCRPSAAARAASASSCCRCGCYCYCYCCHYRSSRCCHYSFH